MVKSSSQRRSIALLCLGLLIISSISPFLPSWKSTSPLSVVEAMPQNKTSVTSLTPPLEIVNSTSVTLITGDKVHLYYLRDGRILVTIDPADPEETGRGFKVFENSHGLYVIPDDVDLRRYDINLFNVKLLADQARITDMKDEVRVIVKGLEGKPLEDLVNKINALAEQFKIDHEVKVINDKLKLVSIVFNSSDRAKLREIFKRMPEFKKIWLDKLHKIKVYNGGNYRVLLSESVSQIGADWVWVNSGVTGEGVKIAILDTGIDFTHKDFYFLNGSSKIIMAKSFVDYPYEEEGDPTDYHGHGTHVAGIAAGTGLTLLDENHTSPVAHPLIVRKGNDEAPIIAGNGTHLAVVWHSDVSGNWDIWFTLYDGEKWSSPIQLTNDPAWDRWPYVAFLSNNRILVMWHSARAGTLEIWYKVYINGSWTEDRQLTTHPEDHDYLPAFTELPNGSIAIAWTSEIIDSNTSNIWFAILNMNETGHLSWVSEKALTNASANAWYFARSVVFTSDNKLWVLWDDLSHYDFETYWGGITSMYYNVSEDYGNSWSGNLLYSCSGCYGAHAVELKNGTLAVFFSGDDYEHNVPDTGYYMKYVDGVWYGPYWLKSDKWHTWRHSAAYGPGGLYVAFTAYNPRYVDNDVYILPPKPIYMGVAPKSLLMIGKVLNKYGWGYDSWVINGIEWAVENGADIISMSLGGPPTDGSDPLSQTVNWAFDQGVLVVVAAGNYGDYFEISAPGVAEKALTVGAVDKYDNIAWFSSKGPTLDFRVKPEVVAPGVNICSSVPEYIYGNPYECWSGTSMATPHVAGVAALRKQYARDYWGIDDTALGIKNSLISLATVDLGSNVYEQGAGRIDARRITEYYNTMDGLYIDPAVINFGCITVGENVSADIRLHEFVINRTLSFTIETYDMISEKYVSNVAYLNVSSITIKPDEIKYIRLSINSTAPPGLYSGKLIITDNYGFEHHVIFGVFVGYNLTIMKTPMEGAGNEWAVSGDEVQVAPLNPKSDFEVRLDWQTKYLDDNGSTWFILPNGSYEIFSLGMYNSVPVFTIYDNLTLTNNTNIVLNEQETFPVIFDPNKSNQVFCETYHAVDMGLRCVSGYCYKPGISWLSDYPDNVTVYYSYSEIVYAIDRYVYYPKDDVNPSYPQLISTKTWNDLYFEQKKISSPVNRIANYDELVKRHVEYRTAAAPRQSASTATWPGEIYITFGWRINIPYSRVEVLSPYINYFKEYEKYNDLPGHTTPYWYYLESIRTGDPGSNTTEIWANNPLVSVSLANFWCYNNNKEIETEFWGFAFANPTIASSHGYQYRGPVQSLSVKVWKNGVEVSPDYEWWWYNGYFVLGFYNVPNGTCFSVEVNASAQATLSNESRLMFEAIVVNHSVIQSPMISRIDVIGSSLNNTVNKSVVNIVFQLYNQSNIQELTFEYSIDDGRTWMEKPVVSTGLNTYKALLTLPEGQNYVSLRINMTDSNGLKTSVTVLRGVAANVRVPHGVGLLRVQTIPPVCTTIYVNGVPRNDWGLDWVKMPEGNYTLSFTDVPGFITPTTVNVTIWPDNKTYTIPLSKPIPVFAGKVTEVKAYFQREGYLKVETYPPLIEVNGKKYPPTIYVNGSPMNDYGVWVALKPGVYNVSFQDVGAPGFTTPPSITVQVFAGYHTIVVGNYTSGESYIKEIKQAD